MIVAVKWKQIFNDRRGRQDMYVMRQRSLRQCSVLLIAGVLMIIDGQLILALSSATTAAIK